MRDKLIHDLARTGLVSMASITHSTPTPIAEVGLKKPVMHRMVDFVASEHGFTVSEVDGKRKEKRFFKLQPKEPDAGFHILFEKTNDHGIENEPTFFVRFATPKIKDTQHERIVKFFKALHYSMNN